MKKKIEESYQAVADFIRPEHLQEIEEGTDHYPEIIPQDIVSRVIGVGCELLFDMFFYSACRWGFIAGGGFEPPISGL